MKSNDIVNNPVPDELNESFDMLYRVMARICKLVEQRIEAGSPELTEALLQFRASGAGRMRCRYEWDPALRLSFEAVAVDGTVREFYWLAGQAYDPKSTN